MSNICHNCIFHEKCMAYRYNNIQTSFMQEINVKKNKEGTTIIYVDQCENFVQRMFKYYPERLRKKKNFNKKY